MRMMIVALAAILSGCTVYKSSDREDFNSNGKARAVTAQKPTLSMDDRDLLVNPCSAFEALNDQQITQLFGPGVHLSMVNQVSSKTATCLVTSTVVDMRAPTVLTCSWKPVNGQPIDVGGVTVQTTEDDLRSEGFDVVSTLVARGETLRMNCEGYALTQSVLDDRKENEGAHANDLHARFRIFARELAHETLVTPIVQH